jgi:neurotransmitter:Na+ symporter, NSS family
MSVCLEPTSPSPWRATYNRPMRIRESSHGYWSSTRAFIWVAAGAAMGLGGVVRLPFLAAQHGGLAFWLVYFLALMLLSWPLLSAELIIGRWTREDVVSGFAVLTKAALAPSVWKHLGVLALASAALILSYYSVIAGWYMAYTLRSASGLLNGVAPERIALAFYGLAQDPERSLAWHTVFMATACLVVAHGARDGIERAASYLAPASLVFAGLIYIGCMLDPEAPSALARLYGLRPSELGWRGVLEALYQAFYSLGLGLGVMIAYGSYLPSQTAVPRIAVVVIAVDALFALLIGTSLFILLDRPGVEPATSVTQMFLQLPQALSPDLGGHVLGILLYVTLLMVTLLSAIALLEPPTRYLMERYRVPRVFAAAYCAIVVWYVGLGTLLSFNVIRDWRFMGQNFFEMLQWLTSRLLVPTSVFLICTYIVRVLPADVARGGWGERDRALFHPWYQLLRYPVRLSLIAVLLVSTGIVDWLVSLWS